MVLRRWRKSRPKPTATVGFTQVGIGAQVKGRLQGSGLVLVHGSIKGRIDLTGELVVCRDGRLTQSKVRSVRIHVEGHAEGQFRIEQAVQVAPGGALFGIVDAREFQSSPGATFAGTVRIAPPSKS